MLLKTNAKCPHSSTVEIHWCILDTSVQYFIFKCELTNSTLGKPVSRGCVWGGGGYNIAHCSTTKLRLELTLNNRIQLYQESSDIKICKTSAQCYKQDIPYNRISFTDDIPFNIISLTNLKQFHAINIFDFTINDYQT